jgi:micrococcal nuclease
MGNLLRELLIILFLGVVVLLFLVLSKENLYDYKVLRTIDGDTVEFAANFLPEPLKPKLSLRILGIDTPEKGPRAQCSDENMKSLKAKLFTEQEINNAKDVKIFIKEWDKYGGRVLGDVILDGKPLSQKLIESGYAVAYDGGKKGDWCRPN